MSNFGNDVPKDPAKAQAYIESFKVAEETCSYPSIFYEAADLSGVGVTFHQLIIILSGIATFFCFLLSFYIIYGHFLHWVVPKEQKQIVLCILYVPVFAGINFFGGWFYTATWDLSFLFQLYNAKGLVAVFLLFVACVCPEGTDVGQYHKDLERHTRSGKRRHDRGSQRWFRIIWVSVFQLVIVTTITFPLNYVITNETCPLDLNHHRRDYTIGLACIQFASTSIAWWAVYIYYRRHLTTLKPRHGNPMLNAFQSLVGLQATQSLIFWVLSTTQTYTPTMYVSYLDFANGVPALLACMESLIFSILFLKIFGFEGYRELVLAERGAKPAKVQRAILDTVNQMDVVRGVVYTFQIMFCMAERKDRKDLEKMERTDLELAGEDGRRVTNGT